MEAEKETAQVIKYDPTRSKIDQYGLAEIVLELRENLSLEKTVEIINKKYLPPGAEPINAMTILRWERRNNIVYDKFGNRMPGCPINPWEEFTALHNRSEKHLQRLNKQIENAKAQEKLSELAALANAYSTALKTHQAIIKDIHAMQERTLRTENVKKVVNLMLKILQKYPEVWSEYMSELKKHKEYEIMTAL